MNDLIKNTLVVYLILNTVYWGGLALMVLLGLWPVMSMGLSLTTGSPIYAMDMIVQPIILIASMMCASDLVE